MSPFPNVFEGAAIFPKKEKTEAKEVRNEKLEALSDHIDYSKKLEIFNGYMNDIEEGLYKEEYEHIDAELGINFMGDPRSSLVSIKNDSPLLAQLRVELLKKGYEEKVGNKNTTFGKIFMDRKPSPLF